MKGFMQQVKSFITFDFPLQIEYIKSQFVSTHGIHQAYFPDWSTKATLQKVVATYWLNHVLRHFAFLYGTPVLLLLLIQPRFQISYLAVVLVVGLISFSVLLLFHYWPNYSYNFLPKLETVKETFEGKHLAELEKCRKAQLSNFSLTLFFYVLTNTNSMDSLKCDDYSAGLLMKLYGVDPGSIKKNLELILGTVKRKSISDRKMTEIQNRFNETYSFLEELKFSEGIKKLREIEVQFFKG